MRRKLAIAVTTLTLVLGFSVQVTAETSDENAFKYRQNIMTALKVPCRSHRNAGAWSRRRSQQGC